MPIGRSLLRSAILVVVLGCLWAPVFGRDAATPHSVWATTGTATVTTATAAAENATTTAASAETTASAAAAATTAPAAGRKARAARTVQTPRMVPGKFLRFWWALGPFDNESHPKLDFDPLSEFASEADLVATPSLALSWIAKTTSTVHTANIVADAEGYLDFRRAFGDSPKQVAYAWTEFESPAAGYTFLRIGSDDAVRVWLNGETVFTKTATRFAEPDQDVVCVKVAKGSNRVVVKLAQGGDEWGLFARTGNLAEAKEGIALAPLMPVEAPNLLVGAAVPVPQNIYVTLLNRGTQDATSFTLACRSPLIPNMESEPTSCPVGKAVTVAVPVVGVGRDLKAGTNLHLDIEARFGGGKREVIGRAQTTVTLAHQLLQTPAPSDGSPLVLVQLSDPHIVETSSVLGKVRTFDRLLSAAAEINIMDPPPSAVVVTGDMTLDRSRGFRQFVNTMGSFDFPVLPAFGNHDKPAGTAAAEREFSRLGLPPHYAFSVKGVDCFVLDSCAGEGQVAGRITPQQVDWIAPQLDKATSAPKLLFLHHDLVSGKSIRDDSGLLALLRATPGEKWIFSGHWHADCLVLDGLLHHVITTTIGYIFEPKGLAHDHRQTGYRIIEVHGDKVRTKFKPLGAPARNDPDEAGWYTTETLRVALRK